MRSAIGLKGVTMLIVGLGWLVGASAADDAEGSGRCFDAAVVVRVVRQEERGHIEDPSDVLGHSLFRLSFRAEQTLYSRVEVPRGTFAVSVGAHGQMRSDIRNLLVFLRRDDSGFFPRWFEVYITRDESGRWVRPLPEESIAEPSASMIFPQFWIPRDPETHLVPLRYRTRDAWWQRLEVDEDGKPIPLSARAKHIEERGFVLADMRDYIASLADQKCQ
jgi:hypothetical protein